MKSSIGSRRRGLALTLVALLAGLGPAMVAAASAPDAYAQERKAPGAGSQERSAVERVRDFVRSNRDLVRATFAFDLYDPRTAWVADSSFLAELDVALGSDLPTIEDVDAAWQEFGDASARDPDLRACLLATLALRSEGEDGVARALRQILRRELNAVTRATERVVRDSMPIERAARILPVARTVAWCGDRTAASDLLEAFATGSDSIYVSTTLAAPVAFVLRGARPYLTEEELAAAVKSIDVDATFCEDAFEQALVAAGVREPDLARPSGLRSAPREQRSATTAVLLARTAKSSLDARACAAEGLLALGVDVASLLDAEDPDRSAVLEAAIASCCAPEALPVLFTMLRDGASGVQGDVLEAAVRRCVAPYVWDASFAGARGRVRASIASEEAARVVAPEWRRVLLE